jgi:hypothetical protein
MIVTGGTAIYSEATAALPRKPGLPLLQRKREETAPPTFTHSRWRRSESPAYRRESNDRSQRLFYSLSQLNFRRPSDFLTDSTRVIPAVLQAPLQLVL